MQHQQQVGGGGYGHLQGGGGGAAAAVVVMSEDDQKLGDLGIAEAASPISSRPPAPTGIGNANFEEMIQATAAEAGGSSSSSNRWPRQETLALLQIRSEMDTAFRDATLKGPLWDQVSRKLGELGYKRSAKKCKEKFENVHKYYKRTKEGRGGRQDGKSYKFFTQLEALHHNTTTTSTSAAVALLPRSTPPSASAAAVSFPPPPLMPQQDHALLLPPNHHIRNDPAATAALFGISFSSDSSSDGEDDDDDDEDMEMDMDLEMGGDRREQRKRKRSHGGGSDSDEKMMDFFEGLLKQVMQKQEAMQQRFLEAIEKREQDRMIREEAWKRQDMARIAREHDLMSQERAISASRDTAIIEFLEKITGQNIVLPSTAVPHNPVVPRSEAQQSSERQNRRDQPPSDPPPPTPPPPPPPQTHVPVTEVGIQQPLHDLGGGGGGMDFAEASSSRWPKAQVLELIKIRSSMEARYQEAGPKGPLWEEISAGMKRIGYNRSAKRCKEKWENINKYFKKVKESNKKRPQDAKTCPYFNELDALYRKKILNNAAAGGGGSTSNFSQQDDHVGILQQPPQSLTGNIVSSEDHKAELQTSGGAFGEHSHATNIGGGEKQPEDMLNKGHDQESRGETTENNNCNSVQYCSNSDDLGEDIYEEVDDNHEYHDDGKTGEEMKMVYKIQFQRQNVASSNGAGTSAPAPSSFVAMVQ